MSLYGPGDKVLGVSIPIAKNPVTFVEDPSDRFGLTVGVSKALTEIQSLFKE